MFPEAVILMIQHVDVGEDGVWKHVVGYYVETFDHWIRSVTLKLSKTMGFTIIT